jgi:hyperosmotically inducible periplasmic protein
VAAPVLLGGLLVAGCASPAPDTNSPPPAMRAMGDEVTAPSQASDEMVGIEIRRRLELADAADTAAVIVEVTDGQVLLRGTAPSLAAGWRAEAAARSVPGVKAVRNQILVRP